MPPFYLGIILKCSEDTKRTSGLRVGKAFKMKFSLLPYSYVIGRITEAWEIYLAEPGLSITLLSGCAAYPLLNSTAKMESNWPRRTLKGLSYSWAGKTGTGNKEPQNTGVHWTQFTTAKPPMFNNQRPIALCLKYCQTGTTFVGMQRQMWGPNAKAEVSLRSWLWGPRSPFICLCHKI